MTVRSPKPADRFVTKDGVLTPPSFELIQSIINTLNGVTDSSGYTHISLGGTNLIVGTGSPNGAVSGSPPDLYFNLSGGAGTTIYVKESGAATTAGWVGK